MEGKPHCTWRRTPPRHVCQRCLPAVDGRQSFACTERLHASMQFACKPLIAAAFSRQAGLLVLRAVLMISTTMSEAFCSEETGRNS